MNTTFINHIFSGEDISDEDILNVFRYQYNQNKVYQSWCNNMYRRPDNVSVVNDIPFLPVTFFKTHKVICGDFSPELIFESSGTTMTISSKHLVKYEKLYEKSFLSGFQLFYGDINSYCILGLLPNYLERKNSSLVKMTDALIKLSAHELSGYYLYDYDALSDVLKKLEAQNQKTILFGVTYALLDFAEKYSFALRHTILMDTGGMKGRKKEITRDEVHNYLKKQFCVNTIHSEYGMTELLSQAYAKDGIYRCPPWMKVLLRDESDPLTVGKNKRGLINVIDLANIYSCSFIATDDIGTIHTDNSFELWGRRDNSDLRGCSLMIM